jgi:hypothetical protein
MARQLIFTTSGDASFYAGLQRIFHLLDHPTPALRAAIAGQRNPKPAPETVDYKSAFAEALAGHEDLMERARR